MHVGLRAKEVVPCCPQPQLVLEELLNNVLHFNTLFLQECLGILGWV
jgi:hypothetical protein